MCWDNLAAVLAEGGMAVTDLLKVTTFVTEPGSVHIARQIRDRKLGGHAPASTYLQVAGLADAKFKCEIEAEAVSEDPDMLFEDMQQSDPSASWRGAR